MLFKLEGNNENETELGISKICPESPDTGMFWCIVCLGICKSEGTCLWYPLWIPLFAGYILAQKCHSLFLKIKSWTCWQQNVILWKKCFPFSVNILVVKTRFKIKWVCNIDWGQKFYTLENALWYLFTGMCCSRLHYMRKKYIYDWNFKSFFHK